MNLGRYREFLSDQGVTWVRDEVVRVRKNMDAAAAPRPHKAWKQLLTVAEEVLQTLEAKETQDGTRTRK